MKYNVYYDTSRRNLMLESVTKERVVHLLKTLTYAEKSHIYIEPIYEKEDKQKEEWER